MKKLVCIIREKKKLKKGKIKETFRLMEKFAGKFRPAADSDLRPGVVDESDDLEVLAKSILSYRDII